ncbi:unnamed protein product [Cuscuta epithymum]|uniref:Wall-associated receptor kinase galacturonan-binding domain-containing protein n=1 Tax=Cuscuta epithymum TaxID=186058 RepID=A0AAV0EX02_9ASTE|nr:unnamed protein product [Cuscuta epithymum]
MASLQMFIFALLLVYSQSVPTQFSKPGCPEKCGNLTIPYPFGIGKECYFDDEFEISCNSSTHVASLPALGGLNIQKISQENIVVDAFNLPFLFNKTTGENLDGPLLGEIDGSHYHYSNTQNKLVSFGCDTFAYIQDYSSRQIVSECATFCNDGNNSSFSDLGHCEADLISHPGKQFRAWMHTMNTPKKL